MREAIPSEEFDYPVLIHALASFAAPRDKITDLLKKGIVVRIKKGIYVFGSLLRRRTISREVLGNLLFGPSYLSLDFALQHHGLIPEGVEIVSSVTTGRSRKFTTPVGTFTYMMIPLKAFRTGTDLVQSEGGLSYYMATPEKALADKLALERGLVVANETEMKTYLLDHLRVPEDAFGRLDKARMKRIEVAYGTRRIALLAQVVAHFPRAKGKRR